MEDGGQDDNERMLEMELEELFAHITPDDFLELVLEDAKNVGPPLQSMSDEEMHAQMMECDIGLFKGPQCQAYYERLASISLFSSLCPFILFSRKSSCRGGSNVLKGVELQAILSGSSFE